MYLPDVHDELTTLNGFLSNQLDALRASAHGLTDEQARQAPARSALSISGILKHCTWVMENVLPDNDKDEATRYAEFHQTFVPTADETIEALLARFDEVRAKYDAFCRQGDPSMVVETGPMPWFGIDEPRPTSLRHEYLHHIEELARHAGHADIIREQLDGATSPELVAAVEGWPENDFVKPWRPESR